MGWGAFFLALVVMLIVVWQRPVASEEGSARETFPRGVYGRDSSASGLTKIAAAGFNITHFNPYLSDLDAAEDAGLMVRVSLGDYDADGCNFTMSDDEVIASVKRVVDHDAVHSYKLADEPSSIRCPAAPSEVAARSSLVRSLDPNHPTTVTLTTRVDYADWVGAVDILDLVVYVCSDRESHPEPGACSMDKIDEVIDRAEDAEVPHYWATLQAHDGHSAGNHFRWPSKDELREEFVRWDASRMEGYFVWCWANDPCPSDIETRPGLIGELRTQNARDFSGGFKAAGSGLLLPALGASLVLLAMVLAVVRSSDRSAPRDARGSSGEEPSRHANARS